MTDGVNLSGTRGCADKAVKVEGDMSTTQIILAVLVFDIILVPPLFIIAVATNLLWVVSIASRLGKLAFPFIGVIVFSLASSFGYWFISDAQHPRDRSAAYYDEGSTRDDCERHPGVYGC